MFVTALVLFLFEATYAYTIGTGALPGGCVTCEVQVGVWSEWSEWTPCSMLMGAMSQSRFRTCSTVSCPGGSFSESRPCTPVYDPQPPPQPHWGEWGAWSGCSASCGGGTSQRTRVCIDVCTGCQCVGSATEIQSCNTQPCCVWSPWSSWSECSVTCGTGGITYRTRHCATCMDGCVGPTSEQMPCSSDRPCPAPQIELPPANPPDICISCYLPKPPCVTCSIYSTWSNRWVRDSKKLR